MKGTFLIKTFGCKVNQSESSHIAEELCKNGFWPVQKGQKADLCIVHGCAVTARASYETRQAIYQLRRSNPEGQVFILMGCAANHEGLRLASKGLVTHVLGNYEKFNIFNALSEKASFYDPYVALSDPRSYKSLIPISFRHMIDNRSRAFLKIQDGCDAFCSYCIVPYLRGKSRSLGLEVVAEKMAEIIEVGFQEVVVTGIHLGQWGQDLFPPYGLMDLLKYLEGRKLVPSKLRLSSLEPGEYSVELIQYLKDKPWFCRHFHIPLQSGDDTILTLMKRSYSTETYKDIIMTIRSSVPDAAIGIDVIVGFPGESDEMFQNTYSFLKSLPFTYLHVFPYSSRNGTEASLLKGQINGQVIKDRAFKLRQLGQRKKHEFMASQLMKKMEVILEKPQTGGFWLATSDNYLAVRVYAPDIGPEGKGSLLQVLPFKFDDTGKTLIARL